MATIDEKKINFLENFWEQHLSYEIWDYAFYWNVSGIF